MSAVSIRHSALQPFTAATVYTNIHILGASVKATLLVVLELSNLSVDSSNAMGVATRDVLPMIYALFFSVSDVEVRREVFQ